MQLDWSTFVLEVINFLVLIWILKRFLYQPVLAVLAERRSRVARSLDEARAAQTQASELQARFERRLAQWEEEKAAARANFEAEMEAERAKQTEALRAELVAQRERDSVRDAHRQETLRHEFELRARSDARRFATALLSRFAGPVLEAELVRLFVEEFSSLPADALAPLTSAPGDSSSGVVTSAHPLPEALRRAVSDAMAGRLGRPLPLEFVTDSALLAGLRISLGARQLDLNLIGELAFFADNLETRS
jgi:F-type H+-transporting ATPase subunit b